MSKIRRVRGKDKSVFQSVGVKILKKNLEDPGKNLDSCPRMHVGWCCLFFYDLTLDVKDKRQRWTELEGELYESGSAGEDRGLDYDSSDRIR